MKLSVPLLACLLVLAALAGSSGQALAPASAADNAATATQFPATTSPAANESASPSLFTPEAPSSSATVPSPPAAAAQERPTPAATAEEQPQEPAPGAHMHSTPCSFSW
eukprot:GHRQ01022607.1.p3 GENE.GHRQ01022607.1~~GHRQ01022607.1.p3  ORF type:complete len:109 (+),score=33.11 GHRQ01022607.1:260-586(+)